MQTPNLNEVKQQAGFSLEDINIEGFAPMPSPAEIKKMAPLTEAAAENVNKSRNQIKQISAEYEYNKADYNTQHKVE